MKRECKTCQYIEYVEDKLAIGYKCTLCEKYVDGVFPVDKETGHKEDDIPEYREYVNAVFVKRKGYIYWCPLVKHRHSKMLEET